MKYSFSKKEERAAAARRVCRVIWGILGLIGFISMCFAVGGDETGMISGEQVILQGFGGSSLTAVAMWRCKVLDRKDEAAAENADFDTNSIQ